LRVSDDSTERLVDATNGKGMKVNTTNWFLSKIVFIIILAVSIIPHHVEAEQIPEKAPWLTKPTEERSDVSRSLIVMAQGLGATLAVFFLGIAIYQRKLQRHAPAKEKKLILREKLLITAKTSVVLIECNGKSLLCAIGPDPVTLLDHSTFMDDLLTEQQAEDEKILENVHILDVPVRAGSL
jgi:flagellar biogenesis protein FliO